MKYLILGGTGNLSESIVDGLHEKGHNVTCVTRGRQRLIEKEKLRRGISFLNVDNINQCSKEWETIFGKEYDIIVDFICYSEEDLRDRLAWIQKIKIKTYILISTTAFYKRSRNLIEPYEEDNISISKNWEYANLKYETETLLKQERKNHDFKTIVIRLGHTIGSLIPVNLGNPGHAYMDFLRETRKVPFIGSIDHNWMIGSSKGLLEVINKLGDVMDTLPKHEIFHYSSVRTTWREIYECLFKAMEIGIPIFIEKQFASIEIITPEWIPSIRNHKIFPDLYNTEKLRGVIGELKSESIQDIITRSYEKNKRRTIENNYKNNLNKIYKVLDG